MDWIIAVLLIAAMGVGVKLLYPKQKPGKACQSCSAFRQCGGGKPRCPRRTGSV